MRDSRERELAEAFVALATGLARGDDVLEMLGGLTDDCARLLDVASAGLLLADRRGVLHLLAASSQAIRDLEIFQLQREQGPCLDCYHSGSAVMVEDLAREADRWPQFAEAAGKAGFRSVHALPMRLGDTILGGLGLFGTSVGALNADDLRLGQAFADVASVALVQDRAASDQEALHQQLQVALDSRVIIEQAKGLLAQLGDLDMDDAFTCLRTYARDRNEHISDVASALLSRQVPADPVLEHIDTRQPSNPTPG